jgi:NADH-quinone oxidoreductase subunit G
MPEPTVKLTIDGKEVIASRGTNVIAAAKLVGVEVPHYCYHPKLKVSGSCRMCLVDVGMPKLGADRKPEIGPDGKPVIMFAPKLAIGCNTPVADGMVVITNSEKVKKAREGVLEFLLINHPLDCPICDQAGECRLQEFSVDYGKGESRFVEDKVHKPKKTPIGPKITLDDERCILCSRCVRFMADIAKQDCLGFVNRGSYSTLTCYPGQEPNTNYDLNIVDICPVGALTSNDFRFKQRVWFLKETKSICPNCATGCNTVLASREGVVYRQTPRENEAVNQCWMCDWGRLNYKFINDPSRLKTPSGKSSALGQRFDLTWSDAVVQLGQKLKAAAANGGASIAAIGSGRATTEELFLFNRLCREQLKAELLDIVPRVTQADNFLVSADKNPNTNGAKLTGVAATTPGANLQTIADGIKSGKVKTLIVHGEDVTVAGKLNSADALPVDRASGGGAAIGEDLLKKLELLVVIDFLPSKTTENAHYVLPSASFVEKRGTFVNSKGRLQRLNKAFEPLLNGRADWQILAALIKELGNGEYLTIEEVFAEMARTLPPLAGLNLSKIGDLGVELKLESSAAMPAAETRAEPATATEK